VGTADGGEFYGADGMALVFGNVVEAEDFEMFPALCVEVFIAA
jgi:hypothetical protein